MKVGAICWHGPHHVAVKSTNTVVPLLADLASRAWKASAVAMVFIWPRRRGAARCGGRLQSTWRYVDTWIHGASTLPRSLSRKLDISAEEIGTTRQRRGLLYYLRPEGGCIALYTVLAVYAAYDAGEPGQ